MNASGTCVCGHADDEHGHDSLYPGASGCTVDGCWCVAFEEDLDG